MTKPPMKNILVDAQDQHLVDKHNWYPRKDGRPYATIAGKTVFLPHLIFGDKKLYDHKDRNPLNNCRNNLREASFSENCRNRSISKNTISGYKGVTKNGNNWSASIRVFYSKIHLGTFTTKEEAALRYDIAAKKYHKEFAALNFDLNWI